MPSKPITTHTLTKDGKLKPKGSKLSVSKQIAQRKSKKIKVARRTP